MNHVAIKLDSVHTWSVWRDPVTPARELLLMTLHRISMKIRRKSSESCALDDRWLLQKQISSSCIHHLHTSTTPKPPGRLDSWNFLVRCGVGKTAFSLLPPTPKGFCGLISLFNNKQMEGDFCCFPLPSRFGPQTQEVSLIPLSIFPPHSVSSPFSLSLQQDFVDLTIENLMIASSREPEKYREASFDPSFVLP